ncbi:MAG: hypothetical protein JO352_05560 [Chloroflexi bacterium]|nr:hypothetical protein [Chloroflexota bacterium]
MEGSTLRRRLGTALVAGVIVALVATGADARSVAVNSASSITNPLFIKKLATKAYVWGLARIRLPLSELQRSGHGTLNSLGGGGAAAAWNNNGG